MVYVKEDPTEEVTDSYITSENGVELAVVECDEGYFIYKIPVVDAPDYADIEGEVLDFASSDMKIIEAPGQSNETVHDGHSSLNVPQKVADRAEEITGADVLE